MIMETYYDPHDLPKFEEMGKEAPDLGKKFFDYYTPCLPKEPSQNGRNR
jgi:hypothetical protein